jgi:hypothetical protein
VSIRFEHPERSVEDNVRKAAKTEFDRAIAEVSETGFEVHGTVRNVRRRLKRIRSLLRLIRPVFPAYAEENRALRQIGAEVGGLRDAMALVEAADLLARGLDGDVADALASLRVELAARAAAEDERLDREIFLGGLRASLRDARVRSELWELDDGERESIVPGLVATYRQARRGLRRARENGANERFHEWRKAVKHHWVHLAMLRRLVPDFADARRQRAQKLARTLGDLQNLCILEHWLCENSPLPGEQTAVVRELGRTEAARLKRRALTFGKPLFDEPPKLVRARWDAYWLDWQASRRMG